MNLYQHQKKIIDEDPKKCGLFLGTGSAKTRTALELAKGKILIICPKTQKEDGNWERENAKWGINKNIKVLSKEMFKKVAHTLPRFDTVICDEAHTVLGATPNIRWVKKQPIPKTSQVFEALDLFLQRTSPERLYLCTATIIRNPMTVWAASKLLDYEFDFYKWRQTFYVRLPMPGREVFAVKSDSETKDRLATVVKKLGYTGQLSDYFDVPNQVYKTIHLELTPAQKARIKNISLEYPDPLVLVGKKHQIENGVLTGDEYNEPESFSNAKLETIADLAIEFPKMVIFVKYTAQIAQIASLLRGMDKKVLILDGSTKDRGNLIADANKSLECVFIAQVQVSSGWELPEYPTMVFASMSYSIVDYIQAIGRIQRANNLKKNLYIHLISKGGVDEAVYKAIQNKQDFNERIYIKK